MGGGDYYYFFFFFGGGGGGQMVYCPLPKLLGGGAGLAPLPPTLPTPMFRVFAFSIVPARFATLL